MFGDHVIDQLHRITVRLITPFAWILRRLTADLVRAMCDGGSGSVGGGVGVL